MCILYDPDLEIRVLVFCYVLLFNGPHAGAFFSIPEGDKLCKIVFEDHLYLLILLGRRRRYASAHPFDLFR